MPPVPSFVGRTSELALLDDALAGLAQGAARAIEVVGPAGIGKTRLLAELAAKAEDRGHLVLTGTGAELEQDLPFWVFVDALDEYVEGLDPRRLERLGERVRAELGQVLPRWSARRSRRGPRCTSAIARIGRCASCSSSSPPAGRSC
jgi:predicted ATPase